MKICFFADGESIHIKRWCNYFTGLGHEVHLISFKNVTIEGTIVHFIDAGDIAVKGGNWKVLLKYPKVKSILKKIKPEVFHAHYATSYGITGALCGFHPYVITTYGTDVLISGQQSKIYKHLLRFAFKKADWINSLAYHMSDAIKKIGADMSKVDVIPFGIDINIFNDAARKNSNEKFVITSTRNFETVYNIQHLIKAVALVQDKIPNMEFRIAGDGSLKPELELLAKKCGIRNVNFLGKITQKEMVELLSETNVFVTVSISDGNSLSLAEAMACGAYCIATNIPANTQWIVDSENGFLVEINDVKGLADKILYTYKNYESLQHKAIPINKKNIQDLGVWENNMKRVAEKYVSLIGQK